MRDSPAPESISRFKKQRFLQSLSEERFRDEVVRPLFLRQGLRDGRDLCGPSEKGKDAYFLAKDKLGIDDLYVVQTKKGKLNLSRKADQNLIEAITQLKTAAVTKLSILSTRQKRLPTKVLLCASGTINDAARDHIVEQVADPRIEFLDSDELIPKIDELMPELWLGIDPELAPYLRSLVRAIENADETLAIADLLPKEQQSSVAAGQGFVMLQLYRVAPRIKRFRGRVTREAEFKQMPLTAVLRPKPPLIAIFGGAGSGKSTSLKWMAHHVAKRVLAFTGSDQPVVPFLLRAPEMLERARTTLVEHLTAEAGKLTGKAGSVFSMQDLTAGRVLAFVDALDEVPAGDGRRGVLRMIQEFHALYPACKVIITSRDDQSIRSLAELAPFEKYFLSPIDHKQAQQIITSLQKGKALAPEKSQELVRRLEQVHGMELNPLLVTVFAATSDYSRQDIPANITELFKKFTEMMLGRWDASKGFKHQYHAPIKDFILSKVAFEMHNSKATKLPMSRFSEIIACELTSRGLENDINVDHLLDEIVLRSGLFLTGDETIEFRHLLIQEFFAGRGIPSADFLHTVVTDPWWTRSIVFYFGENPQESGALRSAIEAIEPRTPKEKRDAALTLGLALQACYLAEVVEKKAIYKWVVDALANGKGVADAEGGGARLLMGFVFYYLFARDSVALSAVQSRAKEMLALWDGVDLTADDKDTRKFWVISGLIECGAISEAEEAVATFNPADPRLLLALHMGCFLAINVRVCSKDQARAAQRICDRLAGRIAPLRQQLLAEFTSELLEVQNDTVKALKPGTGQPGKPTRSETPNPESAP